MMGHGVRATLALLATAALACAAESASITGLPAGLGAVTGKLDRGARRCADRFAFQYFPEELAGLPCVAIPRGDRKMAGRGYAFEVDRKAVVYLFVHNLEGRTLALPGWTQTDLGTDWKGDAAHTDTIFLRKFPKGKVVVPPHHAKKKNGTYGIPHLAVVAARVVHSEVAADPFADMKALGKVGPRRSVQIEASPLSVGFETLDRRMFQPDRTYAHLAKLGVKWARVQTGWARTEETKGRFEFAWLDSVVDSLRKVGIQPWFSLSYGNRLYTPQAPDKSAVGWVPLNSDAARAAWLRYSGAIATRFHGRVRHYEIWNEPNHSGAFWRIGKPSAKRYVELVRISAGEIRKHVPDAVIIGGAYAGTPTAYFKQCLEAGMADLVDKVSYHPYRPMPEGGGYDKQIRQWRQLLARHKPGLTLWQGENGAPSQRGGVGAMANLRWTETRQAKWLTRRILTDLGLGVELTSYFHTVDLVNYNWGRGGTGKTNFKGLLRGTDYTPKPSYFAYQCLCALFDSETKQADLKARFEVAAGGGRPASVCWGGFSRGGRALVAYWLPTNLLRFSRPRQVTVSIAATDAARLTQPVLIDPLTSTVYEVAGVRGKGGGWRFEALPLLNHPLLLIDAAAARRTGHGAP